MRLSNKLYDILKWVIMYVVPSVGGFMYTITRVWNIPCGDQIVDTIMAVGVCIAGCLAISTHNYNKSQSVEARSDIIPTQNH